MNDTSFERACRDLQKMILYYIQNKQLVHVPNKTECLTFKWIYRTPNYGLMMTFLFLDSPTPSLSISSQKPMTASLVEELLNFFSFVQKRNEEVVKTCFLNISECIITGNTHFGQYMRNRPKFSFSKKLSKNINYIKSFLNRQVFPRYLSRQLATF